MWTFTARVLLAGILILGMTGCSYLFYPRAGEFKEKAKGATPAETVVNLTTMLEASAKAAHGGKGYDTALNDLHNQFHALHDSLCDLTAEQKKMPAYAAAVTIDKEMWVIFKRLWKFKDDQPQRDDHLDRFAKHAQALRETVQSLT